jgi:tryptophanyl-tRNA synthetase
MFHCGGVARRSLQRNHVTYSQTRALSTPTTRPKTIFSGIQPTGVPHLGNYLGALRQWVRLQDEAADDTTLIYSLVDLHAITIRQDPKQLRQWKKESLAMLLAIGLDAKRSTIFHQSDVPAHAELMWILSCQASTGYLGRMTQWKDKTSNEKDGNEKLKLGLFSYPVLQAADILVHKTTHVPVGHDQAQHLEFARDVANGFNHVFGQGKEVLIAPETLISPAKRVMSLIDPTAKMSKSHPNPKSRILLTDGEDAIKSKIKAAVTDSIDGITYDPEARPGVSNLIDLLYHTGAEDGYESQEVLASDLEGVSLRALKAKVAESIDIQLQPIRERYAEIIHDRAAMEDAAGEGAEKANKSALRTLQKVKRAVGFT